MTTKGKVLLGLIVIGVGAGAYFVFKPKKLKPFDKMLLDVLNPNSPAGQAQRNYLRSVNVDPEDVPGLTGFVIYRMSHPDDHWTIAYNQKSEWGKDEIVNG